MPPNRIPNNTLNAAELRGGLERLPQELYDTIVDMVLSIDSKQDLVNPEGRTLRRMTPHTRPPPQMQINQELHASISIAYYSKSTFHFTELWVLLKWVKSLSRRSRNLLRDIRCLTSFRDMDFSNFRDSRMMEQIDRILYPYPYSPPTCGHILPQILIDFGRSEEGVGRRWFEERKPTQTTLESIALWYYNLTGKVMDTVDHSKDVLEQESDSADQSDDELEEDSDA